jgi:putative methyltransferase (TIGR04325 family)
VHEIGGGSGHLYQTFRMLFQDIQTEWTNIETPTMVSAIEGKNFPGLRHIKWNDFILNNNLGSDIVIANSSLQYFENPIKTLSDFLSVVEAKFLFIGKSPISANSQQVGIQISKLSSNGPQYKSQPIGSDAFREKCKIITYPIRTISENELLNLLDSWRIVFSFPEGYIDFDVSCSIFAPFFEHRFCKMQRIQTHSILFEKK